MRVIVLYRPNSEHARQVEDYLTDFRRFHPGLNVEAQNVDSVEGAAAVKLYGIMEYPTILAVNNDGQMQQTWSGVDKLPLMNDLAYFAQQ